MPGYTTTPPSSNEPPPERATAQFEHMLRIIVRETIARTSAAWLERWLRKYPDNWLDDRLALIEREEVTDLLETVRLWGMTI